MGKDLLIACAVGDLSWVKLCLDKGADPLYSNHEGWSALHMAAMNTKLDCVQFLVEQLKIDVNITSQTGWTPLHLAARGKPENPALDCVTYLIRNGAHVNKLNEMKISPIHQAVSANNLQCVATLVKSGACVTQPDKRGLLPLDVAKVWGHSECSKYLQNVMWMQQKKEEEKLRKRWIIEYQKTLEKEIDKYTESKLSPRVQNAYNAWSKSKGSNDPNMPTHSLTRAKSLSCYQDPKIPEFRRLQLSQKIRDRIPYPSSNNNHRYSPRQQLERVKKIQELRRKVTIKERDNTGPLSPQIIKIPPKFERIRPKNTRRDNLISSDIGPPIIDKRRKPRKDKPKDREQSPVNFAVQVDNYFKESSKFSPDYEYGDDYEVIQKKSMIAGVSSRTSLETEGIISPSVSDIDLKSENSLDVKPDSKILDSIANKSSLQLNYSRSVTFNDSVEFKRIDDKRFYNSSRILNHSQLRSCLKKSRI